MTPLVSAEHPSPTRPKIERHARPLIAAVLGLASVAVTYAPTIDGVDGGWISLALLVPVVSWCALPVHLAAVRGLGRGRLNAWGLASAGILAAFAWSVGAVAADGAMGHLVPVALTTLLAVVAQHVAELAGHRESADPAPAWLPPLVLTIAAAACVVWWLADGWEAGASAGVSVLLVAGPAALLVAEPSALLVAGRRGAEIGMLTADVDAMRATQHIDTIVLDKDGTVTTGELSVMSVDPVDPDHVRNLRWFAGALAHSSDHPVARAIAKLAPRGRVSNVVTQPLIGISGSVDRHPVRIGIPRWIGVDDTGGLGTQVGVEVDGRALGWITVADTIRPDAQKGVERLGSLGLRPILVCERPEADTAHIAAQAGIDLHYARMTVDKCVSLVQELQAEGRVVAMAGRLGANEPALRAADLAISTAGEVTDGGIALSEVDVHRVGDAIVLLRSTRATMLANRRWATAGMLVPVAFAVAGLIAPLYAPLVAAACLIGIAVNSSRIPHKQRPTTDRPV